MDLAGAIEIFALVSGLAYVVLEIGQRNAMWVLGVHTGVACAYSFATQHLWASMALNVYYVAVSVWGFIQWRRDARKVGGGPRVDSGSTEASGISASARATSEPAGEAEPGRVIHLRSLSTKTLIISCVATIAGSIGLFFLLRAIGDSSSVLDAVVTVLSAVATVWLALSIPQQWILWIVADLLSTVLCAVSGLWWMAFLYFAYAASAVYGYFHWTRKGTYVDN